MGKWNYEKAKGYVELTGCKFLSNDFSIVKDKYLFECKCGNVFKATFDSFTQKDHKMCNDCSRKINGNKRKLSYDFVKEQFEKRGYTLVDTEYKTERTKMKYICPKHQDVIQEISYAGIRSGRGCRLCANEAIGDFRRLSIEDAEKAFADAGYELVPGQTYVDAQTKMKYICPKHGVQEMHLGNIKFGRRCPMCANEKRNDSTRLTYEYVREQFEKEGYKLISTTYVRVSNKLKYLCPEHGIQKITYNDFQQGRRCPYCTGNSRGELAILKWLDSHNITHSSQYTFDDLVSDKGSKLRFDFAVFNKDNQLIKLLEFDGIQHFKPVDRFGGKEEFERRKLLDEIKTEYCKRNNIRLLRIPYTEFSNLDEILTREVGDALNV